MLTIMDLLRGLGVAAIALVILQQADRGIWWHFCHFRSIRTKVDADELYRTRTNKFLVPTKVIPAALACAGVAWMVALDRSVGGLLLSLAGILAFSVSSMIHAHLAIGPA